MCGLKNLSRGKSKIGERSEAAGPSIYRGSIENRFKTKKT